MSYFKKTLKKRLGIYVIFDVTNVNIVIHFELRSSVSHDPSEIILICLFSISVETVMLLNKHLFFYFFAIHFL